MAKNTNESEKIIEQKLEYIGLNLDKVPKSLKEFEPLNYRPIQSYDDTTYRVYKYVNVKDIQILITPTDRLTDIKEKYKLAAPLFTHLDGKNEENIEKFAIFLKMISDLKLEKIKEIEVEQVQLKEHLPTKIKYDSNFIWQIYYSDYAQKYFMLVPTKEQDNSAMFYLLKKQLGSRKKENIFVPISDLEYSGQFLTRTEIADIENYLWYFAKDWPSVYEVYDEKDNLMIKIVGNTHVYEKIKSDYVITLRTKQEAIEFYKLLKALFILSTGIPSEYQFVATVNDDGNLKFEYKDMSITYSELSNFIGVEYKDKIEKLNIEIAEKKKLEKRLKRFQTIVSDLIQDYLERQKQISTFLECKKSFFGKVKYFFKKKKEVQIVKKPQKIDREDSNSSQDEKNLYEEKEQYTIEDLIDICTKLDEKVKENTNLNLDINAIENKKDILSQKVDNADLYIKEIDNHKKSIFEFWKFTSKDETQTLGEGQEQEERKTDKIAKFFDYENDLEDLGKKIDEVQRRKLSKNETDAVFAAKHVITSIRQIIKDREKLKQKSEDGVENVISNSKVLEDDLKHLKEEYKDNLEYINIKDFDIFGGLSEDKTKIKTINNEKHREIEKDKYKVLNVNLETNVQEYSDNLEEYIKLIEEALNKIKSPYDMSIYKVNTKKGIDGINVFDINPQNALKLSIQSKKENIILCRINIKENMPAVYYSNIMFYDNFNKTLPLGMNLSTEVLFDVDKVNLKYVKETDFSISYDTNEFETVTKKVKVYEYEAESRFTEQSINIK